MASLNFENIGDKFVQVVHTPEWEELQQKFNDCNDIYVLGHGGNMAVADHAAVDMTRLSNGTKNAMCPSSGVVATSSINDTSFEQWISSKDIPLKVDDLTKVILGADYYHTAEVLTLLLTYQLTHGSGNVCPPIGQNDPNALKKLSWKGGKIREHSYPDEQINVGIDFDKVIHKCSKGYYDGTIYDTPVEGAREALERLSKDYTVIVYTCKAKPDRGLVNGKTGTELVWEWLKENDMAQFVSKVTAEKPRARFYVDDKAIRFTDWESAFKQIEEIDG